MSAKQEESDLTTPQGTPEEIVLQMTASMEALATEEDWQGVENISEKLRRLVLQVPEDQRGDTLLAVQRSVEKVKAAALEARHQVSDRLAGIKRGKDATRAYVDATGA